jgi:hypothetical protein
MIIDYSMHPPMAPADLEAAKAAAAAVNNSNSLKQKRHRTRFTPAQLNELERSFSKSQLYKTFFSFVSGLRENKLECFSWKAFTD